MADDGILQFPRTSREVAKLASIRPADVIAHPQANAYGFAPVRDIPRPRFHPADGGAVRLGPARLDAEAVEALAGLFQREAAKAMREGDHAAADRIWALHDDLSAAESGLTPEPPPPLSAA